MLKLSVLPVVTAIACGAPPISARDWDDAPLLDQFRPILYFVDNGPGGLRVDYPSSYVPDDPDVENNFHLPQQTAPSLCYGMVHEQRDLHDKACWVAEYHYYYARNWAGNSPPIGCTTHEHDWEWVYIAGGYLDGIATAYCACFSAHAENNPDLFQKDGAVRLFPSVAGGSLWRKKWDSHPDHAPRASIIAGQSVEATSLDRGNAFDGAPWQPRSPDPWVEYAVIDFETMTTSCGDVTRFHYGDPQLGYFCIGRSSRGECDDRKDPPWLRPGLGHQNPLPAGFALPEDWDDNPSTEAPPSLEAGGFHLRPNPCRGWVDLISGRSAVPGGVRIHDAAGRIVRHLSSERGRVDGSRWRIDLTGLANGVYWLAVDGAGDGRGRLHVLVLR